MSKYVLIINTPGFLPTSTDEPFEHDTAREAWLAAKQDHNEAFIECGDNRYTKADRARDQRTLTEMVELAAPASAIVTDPLNIERGVVYTVEAVS